MKRTSTLQRPSKQRKITPKVKMYKPMYYGAVRSVEKKFIDTAGNLSTLNATPQIILLNGVATGTDYNTRIGREARMTSEYIRLIMSSTVTSYIRMMIIYDKQPNGTAITGLTDLLVNATVISPNNLNNKERFSTLYDEVYRLDTASQLALFDLKYKKLGLGCTYSGTGNTIASISTGALYLIVFSNSDTPTLSYYNRVRFVDL